MADFDPDAYLAGSGGGGGFDPDQYLKDTAPPASTAQDVLGQQSAAAHEAMQQRATQTLPETMRGFLGEAQQRTGQGVSEVMGQTQRGQVSPGVTQGQWTPGRGVAIKPYGAPAPGTEVSRARQIAGGAGDILGGATGTLTAPVKAFAGVPIERATGVPVETQSNLLGAATALAPGAGGIFREAGYPELAPVTTSKAELKQASKQLYNEASGLGVEFHRKAISNLSDDIISSMENGPGGGFRRLDAPSTWSKVEELKKPAGATATITDLESVRKALGKVPPQERGASSIARRAIDDYLANIDQNPGHIANNEHFADRLAGIMKEARGNWAAMERGETIANAVQKAVWGSGVSGNLDTKLRSQIKTVLNSAALKNKGGYNPDEIAAMEAIVAGKNSTNAARLAGSAAPHGAVRIGATTMLGGLFPGHHLAATAIISALGKISKSFGDKQTLQRVNQLIDQVRARSPLHQSKPQPTPPVVSPFAGASGAATTYAGAPQEHAAGGRAEGGPADDDSDAQDQALAASMTHYAEQPNPAAPYIQAAKDFGSGGLQKMLGLPNNAVGRALQSDAANTALGVMTPMKGAGVLKGAAEAEAASPGITAYHGSPHDFDKFDISKIGTGEGAQSYGHGLYFAESPGTAEHYRDTISQSRGTPVQELMAQAIKGRTKEEAIKEFRQIADNLKDKPEPRSYKPRYTAADYAEAANRLEQGEQHGRMYQVAIKAEPHEFLDWDKTLSEQSPKVQEAINRLGLDGSDPYTTGEELLKELEKVGGPAGKLSFQNKGPTSGPEVPSNYLRQAGIPGIRYLDQGSRAGGEGTHNYVVFDDKLVDILKKYGLAGLVASGAYHYQDKAQAQGRASGGRVEAAHNQSRVGLAENPSGVPFRCSTCMFIKKGVCQNPDSLLHLKKVKPLWCCAKYDRPDMKMIV